MKKVIYSEKAPAPIGPYSQAMKVGNLLFVSGQIPINRQTGKFENESVEKETDQVMQNLKYILDASNTSFENVIKCSIFIADMKDFEKVNGIYNKYFNDAPPARETVAVRGLPKDARVEISCIAHVED